MTRLLPCLLLLMPAVLQAHSLGESYGVLRGGSGERSYAVTYNMRRDQFLQLAELEVGTSPLAVVAAEVRERYRLVAAGQRCESDRFEARETRRFFQVSFVARCAGSAPVELRNDAFFDLLPEHLHFLRVAGDDGGFLAERVMDRASRTWLIPRSGSASLGDVARRFAALGMEHMAFGYDHLAFLLSLLLLTDGPRRLFIAITGFTLGHSVSLALTVLGFAVPDGRLVEALIGLTIALVAAESVFRRQRRLGVYAVAVIVLGTVLVAGNLLYPRGGPGPLAMAGITLLFSAYLLLSARNTGWQGAMMPLLTTFFGLIHGFGFAGSILEIGLPGERLALALLSFNLGIELAQILLITALLALLIPLRRISGAPLTWEPVARTALAGLLVGLGVFWFVSRGY